MGSLRIGTRVKKAFVNKGEGILGIWAKNIECAVGIKMNVHWSVNWRLNLSSSPSFVHRGVHISVFSRTPYTRQRKYITSWNFRRLNKYRFVECAKYSKKSTSSQTLSKKQKFFCLSIFLHFYYSLFSQMILVVASGNYKHVTDFFHSFEWMQIVWEL